MAELKELWALLADASLKAYYRMESGALTTDSSPNSKTLTNNNAVASGTGKYFGGADLGNSNSNKSLSIADALGLTANGAASVSFWVKMNTEIASGVQRFIQMNFIGPNGSTFWIDYEYNAGTRRIKFARYGSALLSVFSTLTMGTSAFHHFVLTFDGSTVICYIDNSQVGTFASSGYLNAANTSLSIGCEYSSNNYPLSAIVDDIAIFSKKLSVDEIALLYNNLSATVNYLTNYRGRKRTPGAVSV